MLKHLRKSIAPNSMTTGRTVGGGHGEDVYSEKMFSNDAFSTVQNQLNERGCSSLGCATPSWVRDPGRGKEEEDRKEEEKKSPQE